jgi:hypothetical protein
MSLNTWQTEGQGEWQSANSSNTAPTVTVTSNKSTYEAGETITFTATGSDADGDALTYLWSSGETSQAITVTAPTGSSPSTVTRSCVVNDGTVNSSSSSETVNVNAEVIESTLNLSLTGIPNGSYSVRFINTANNASSFTQDVTFTGGVASVVLSLPTDTLFEYYTVDQDAYGLAINGITT